MAFIRFDGAAVKRKELESHHMEGSADLSTHSGENSTEQVRSV
jgi:hypothetical protein